MFADITGESLQLAGQFDQGPHFLVVLVQAAQFRFLLNGLVERHPDLERNQLGNAIHETIGMTQHPTHVAHHRLGCHATVGGNLGNPVAAVTLGDVFDHPVAAFHAEIDVEIRHRHPFGIQESFEQQIVGQRVQVGDAKCVSD